MRIQPRKITQYPLWLKPFFWSQLRRYGKVLTPGLLWARVPKLFSTVALLYGALDRGGSPLSPTLRSLVTVRVSQINHCAFCIDINQAKLMERCGSEEKVKHLHAWRAHIPLFSPCEQAVLAYTEAMTHSEERVTEALFAALKAHFDDDGIIELTALVAFQNLSSKFNEALDVSPQGFCRID